MSLGTTVLPVTGGQRGQAVGSWEPEPLAGAGHRAELENQAHGVYPACTSFPGHWSFTQQSVVEPLDGRCGRAEKARASPRLSGAHGKGLIPLALVWWERDRRASGSPVGGLRF